MENIKKENINLKAQIEALNTDLQDLRFEKDNKIQDLKGVNIRNEIKIKIYKKTLEIKKWDGNTPASTIARDLNDLKSLVDEHNLKCDEKNDQVNEDDFIDFSYILKERSKNPQNKNVKKLMEKMSNSKHDDVWFYDANCNIVCFEESGWVDRDIEDVKKNHRL